MRRLMVICAYLLLMLIVCIAILGGIATAGLVSTGCIDNDHCSAGERVISLAAPLTLLALGALVISLGWKGRLFGARRS